MDIVETDVGGALVVEPIGGIDSTNAKEFVAKVMGAFNAKKSNLIIDFQQVKYMSSAGFRSLLIIGNSVENAQRKLVLCGMGTEVQRVFEVAKFNDFFVICASREEATEQAK